MSPPKKTETDQLTIRLGQWFEASASGRLSVITVALLVVGAFFAKLLQWW